MKPLFEAWRKKRVLYDFCKETQKTESEEEPETIHTPEEPGSDNQDSEEKQEDESQELSEEKSNDVENLTLILLHTRRVMINLTQNLKSPLTMHLRKVKTHSIVILKVERTSMLNTPTLIWKM